MGNWALAPVTIVQKALVLIATVLPVQTDAPLFNYPHAS
jgi:hypothetical protein